MTVEEKLKADIDYWNCEGLIAQEQGDEEQAKKYFEKAAAIARTLDDLRNDYSDHR